MTGILGPKLGILLSIVRSVRPSTYIEVGCYRCDTMRAVRETGIPDRVIGFDLFLRHEGDADRLGVGNEYAPLNGPPCTVDEARAMGFEVYAGDSKTTLDIIDTLDLDSPILVFLDGGHSYETVKSDFEKIARYCPDAVVVFDDISYAGPAKVIGSIDKKRCAPLGRDMLCAYAARSMV